MCPRRTGDSAPCPAQHPQSAGNIMPIFGYRRRSGYDQSPSRFLSPSRFRLLGFSVCPSQSSRSPNLPSTTSARDDLPNDQDNHSAARYNCSRCFACPGLLLLQFVRVPKRKSPILLLNTKIRAGLIDSGTMYAIVPSLTLAAC
jgi:hypothetical protein